MNRRQLLKTLLATSSVIIYSWYSLPETILDKTNSSSQKLPRHFIGLGNAGAQIVKHFHAQGITGKFTIVSTDCPREFSSEIDFVQLDVTSKVVRYSDGKKLYLIPDENAELVIPNRVIDLLQKDEQFILLAGLGGSSGSKLMQVLTLKLHKEDKMFHSICSLPFRFEGVKRRKTAIKALNDIHHFKNVHLFELETLRAKHGNLVLSNAFEKGNEEYMAIYNKLIF